MQNLYKCPKIKRFPCIEISPGNQWNYFTLWQDQSWRCRLEALHHKTGRVGAFFFPKAQLKRGEFLEPTCAEDSIMILFSQVWVKIFKTTPRNRQIREKAASKLRDGELTPCNGTMRGTQTGRCRYRWCFCLKLCRFFQHLNQQYFPIIWSFVEVMWKIPPTATFTHPASIWNRSLQTLFSYWTCNPQTIKA